MLYNFISDGFQKKGSGFFDEIAKTTLGRIGKRLGDVRLYFLGAVRNGAPGMEQAGGPTMVSIYKDIDIPKDSIVGGGTRSGGQQAMFGGMQTGESSRTGAQRGTGTRQGTSGRQRQGTSGRQRQGTSGRQQEEAGCCKGCTCMKR